MQLDQSPELPSKRERVSLGRLARDSAFELMLTLVLLFGVVSIVRWVIGPSPISRAISGIHAELWIVGATVGLLLAGLILSPPGRASGGHAADGPSDTQTGKRVHDWASSDERTKAGDG